MVWLLSVTRKAAFFNNRK